MKRYRLIIFIATIIFLLISCSQKEKLNVYEIINTKILVFPLDSMGSGKPYDALFRKNPYNYCFIDGIETLIIPINKNRLAFYNLTTQKEYHSVPILQNRSIRNFNFVSKDSIFVFYEIEYIDTTHSKYEPMYLQLLNYAGEAKICEYNIDISNFDDCDDIKLSFDIDKYRYPIIANNSLFFTTETSINNIGTKTYLEKQLPIFACYDAQTKKIKLSKNIKFPDISEGIFYNTNFSKLNYCLSANNLPLLRFFYSSTVYEWDYRNDQIIPHSLKSRIIDTIPPLKTEYALPQSLNAVYGEINYDKYNKIYYSYLYLNEILYGNYYSILILTDDKFNYLGELLNPPMDWNVRFSKDNIVSYYYYNDSIHVYFQKLIKTNRSLLPYLDSVRTVLGLQKQAI